MTATLRKTPLHDAHVAAGAKMTEFGGWSMPVWYGSIKDEHRAVRTKAGLFDLSHMGRVELRGASRVALLDRLATNEVAGLAVGEARYALFCDERGGTVDDIVYYVLPDRLLVVVNASNREKDVAWMREQARAVRGAEVVDRSDELAMIAIQGPLAAEILAPLTTAAIADLGYYRGAEGLFLGTPAVIGRTGYTGEDGFEVYFPREQAERAWGAVLDAGRARGLVPVGLGARDTLRLEAGMALYGHELTADIDPLEAGLGFAVKLQKPADFVGKAALAARKAAGAPARRLVCIEGEGRKIPREGHAIYRAGEAGQAGATDPVGKVTSGTFSPTFEKPIAMGYVAAAAAEVGTPLEIDVRGERLPSRIVKKPFYKRPK